MVKPKSGKPLDRDLIWIADDFNAPLVEFERFFS
jgi:hypothetical protein